MIDASAEFFMVEMNSLPRAGTMDRTACGAITRRMRVAGTSAEGAPGEALPRVDPLHARPQDLGDEDRLVHGEGDGAGGERREGDARGAGGR